MRSQANSQTGLQATHKVNGSGNKKQPTEPIIDVHKALKLRLINNLTYQEIADTLGCSKSGIHKALQRVKDVIDTPELTDQFRQHKAKIVEGVQLKYLVHLANKDTIKAASANNAAYALGQLNNIIRLDRDQSTTNAAIKAEISFLSPGDEVPDNTADISFNEGNDDGS